MGLATVVLADTDARTEAEYLAPTGALSLQAVTVPIQHMAADAPLVGMVVASVPRMVKRLGTVSVAGVELRFAASNTNLRVGELVTWSVVLLNKSPSVQAQALATAEFAAPDGMQTSISAAVQLTHVGDLTLVRIRLYPAPGCEWRAGINTVSVGNYPGQEKPVAPAVVTDATNRVCLLVEQAVLRNGQVLAVRYTTTVVGLAIAPEGRIVVNGETVTPPPPPPM